MHVYSTSTTTGGSWNYQSEMYGVQDPSGLKPCVDRGEPTPVFSRQQTEIICHEKTWLAIMLLAGDIQTNPGPRQNYPCTVWHENVKTKDPSVRCDICEGWSHTVCVGIHSDEYRELCGKDTFTFFCPRCTLSELPSYQSSSEHDLDSTNSIDNSRSEATTTSGIRVVNINVNGLKGTANTAYTIISTLF